MPSDKFLLETERPENILISEEEYIQKYNKGEIDDDYASPYILEKLKKDNNNNNTINPDTDKIKEYIEQQQSINNNPDASGRNNKKPGDIIINKGKPLSKINQRLSQEEKKKNMQEEKIKKVKTFLYHGWDFHQEHNNTYEGKYNNKTFQTFHRNNIIDDIYSLSNKKNNFFKKISIISNTNNYDTKKIYSLNS